MPIKFTYDEDQALLRIDGAGKGEKLTEQQAMIVAVSSLANGMHVIGQALWELQSEFSTKRFYDEDSPRAAAPKKASKKKR